MMEEVVSTFHIHVRKCCASCAHKDLTRAVSARYCSVHDKNVKPCDYCKEWRLSEQLKNAGNALGKVKRHDYLMCALDIRHNEAEKEDTNRRPSIRFDRNLRIKTALFLGVYSL